MFENFCDGFNLDEERSKYMSAEALGSPGYEEWRFVVGWRPNGKQQQGCPPESKEVYKKFGTSTWMSYLNLIGPLPKPNHHTWGYTYRLTSASQARSTAIRRFVEGP